VCSGKEGSPTIALGRAEARQLLVENYFQTPSLQFLLIIIIIKNRSENRKILNIRMTAAVTYFVQTPRK
jgi:hypothetical protein